MGILLSRIEAKDWEKLLEVLDSQLKKMCKIRLGASNYRPKTAGRMLLLGEKVVVMRNPPKFIEMHIVLLYGRGLGKFGNDK